MKRNAVRVGAGFVAVVVAALAWAPGCGDSGGEGGASDTSTSQTTGGHSSTSQTSANSTGNQTSSAVTSGSSTCDPNVGDQCQYEDDCCSKSCLYGDPNDNFGYCTKTCNDFSDCPDFWDCVQVENAPSKYCVQSG